jgi:hypothetical protein
MKKHHPTNRAERLYLNRKYFLKHSRAKPLEKGKEYAGGIFEETAQESREGGDEASLPSVNQGSSDYAAATVHT